MKDWYEIGYREAMGEILRGRPVPRYDPQDEARMGLKHEDFEQWRRGVMDAEDKRDYFCQQKGMSNE